MMRSIHSRVNARQRLCAARGSGGTPAGHWRIRHVPILSAEAKQVLTRVRQRIRGRRWPGPLIPLPLLLIVLLLAGWSALGAANAKSNAQPLAARQQLASGPRTVARWIDPADGTALLVALLEAPNQPPGAFTFTLPSGDEIRAQKVGSPLLALARQLSQLSANASFDVAITVCGPATLVAAKSTAAAAAIAQPVAMVLGVHVGQGGLLAYAGLSYVALGQSAFAASACVLTSPQYEMKAGCSDLTSPCAPLLVPTQAVAQYDQAVVGAGQTGDWNRVWVRTSQASPASCQAVRRPPSSSALRARPTSSPTTP
jgi:hypothetical protein